MPWWLLIDYFCCSLSPGIIDARHMIAKPEIFFNESLPFFSKMNSADGEYYSQNSAVYII